MEVAHDTAEVISRLKNREADVAAMEMPPVPGTHRCRNHWLVNSDATELAQSIDSWYTPEKLAQYKERARKPIPAKRSPRPAMLDAASGKISRYDALFQRHASAIGWDWRLLAAQCYQESAFDPNAVSWAGAQGLMQIMPGTASLLGVTEDIFEPEVNIEAAVRYLQKLNRTFADVGPQSSRIPFILAAYNGGASHVRDAMALAKKHGHNEKVWRDVEPYILLLSEPRYYQDPVVKAGYLRGSETHDYVRRIIDRWAQYRGQARNFSKANTPTPSKNPRTPAQIRRPGSFIPDSL